jgi:hypothetical protein
LSADAHDGRAPTRLGGDLQLGVQVVILAPIAYAILQTLPQEDLNYLLHTTFDVER